LSEEKELIIIRADVPLINYCAQVFSYLGNDVGKFGVEPILNVPSNRPFFPITITDHGEQHGPNADGHQDVVETEPIADVILFKNVISLPSPIPVFPPDAHKYAAEAHGHYPRQQHQLDPVDHVERVHVDQSSSEKKIALSSN
jgi:hypothetical protein